jgi:hypothetical protein
LGKTRCPVASVGLRHAAEAGAHLLDHEDVEAVCEDVGRATEHTDDPCAVSDVEPDSFVTCAAGDEKQRRVSV